MRTFLLAQKRHTRLSSPVATFGCYRTLYDLTILLRDQRFAHEGRRVVAFDGDHIAYHTVGRISIAVHLTEQEVRVSNEHNACAVVVGVPEAVGDAGINTGTDREGFCPLSNVFYRHHHGLVVRLDRFLDAFLREVS